MLALRSHTMPAAVGGGAVAVCCVPIGRGVGAAIASVDSSRFGGCAVAPMAGAVGADSVCCVPTGAAAGTLASSGKREPRAWMPGMSRAWTSKAMAARGTAAAATTARVESSRLAPTQAKLIAGVAGTLPSGQA